MGSSAERDANAFTLIELLVVISIIMLLAGMLMPALSAVRENGRKTRAKADVRQLEMAYRAVLLDYRTWAAASLSANNNMPADNAVVSYLAGISGGAPSNPKGIRYMEFDNSSLDTGNNFVDPWIVTPRQPYHIALGDSSISVSGTALSRQVGAWSLGKAGASAHYADLIKSWE